MATSVDPDVPFVTTAVTVVNAAIEPGRLNARSNGEFVTAFLGVPEGADAAGLVLESVVVAGVRAVTDDTCGFVRTVLTSTGATRSTSC